MKPAHANRFLCRFSDVYSSCFDGSPFVILMSSSFLILILNFIIDLSFMFSPLSSVSWVSQNAFLLRLVHWLFTQGAVLTLANPSMTSDMNCDCVAVLFRGRIVFVQLKLTQINISFIEQNKCWNLTLVQSKGLCWYRGGDVYQINVIMFTVVSSVLLLWRSSIRCQSPTQMKQSSDLTSLK